MGIGRQSFASLFCQTIRIQAKADPYYSLVHADLSATSDITSMLTLEPYQSYSSSERAGCYLHHLVPDHEFSQLAVCIKLCFETLNRSVPP